MKSSTLLSLTAIAVLAALSSDIKVHAQGLSQQPTSTGCWRQSVPAIHVVPPLRSDMTLETFLGYAWLDSICRSVPSWNTVDSLASRITSWDTAKCFAKYLFAVSAYDETLLRQYFMAQYLDSAYKLSPGGVVRVIRQRIRAVVGDSSPVRRLLSSAIILRVRVSGVTTDYDSLAKFPSSPLPLICITADVLDTIKGQHFISAGCQNTRQVKAGNQIQETLPCVKFTFSPQWEKRKVYTDDHGIMVDSLGRMICDTCYAPGLMQVGNEYIVALNEVFLDYDGISDYFNYIPSQGYDQQGGIWPIVSGYVKDDSNFWQLGTSVATSDFIAGLRADMFSLLHP